MNDSETSAPHWSCPITAANNEDMITLAHGGGGQLSQALVHDLIKPALGGYLQANADSATLTWLDEGLAFTTDSYVVHPTFFPGGHIGEMAVIGTANDLAMVGAQVQFLSCSLIIEEGFSLNTLTRIITDMQKTAARMGAHIVTGDTKVVERGKGDGLFINTAGLGKPVAGQIGPPMIAAGDSIIVSGDLGRHGAAIMAARDDIEIEGLSSDLEWLGPGVNAILKAGITVHCMRDLTRGGLVSALYECAEAADLSFHLVAEQIPISEPVQCLCELTGIDPLHLANEGRFVIFCPRAQASQVIAALHRAPTSAPPAIIGTVKAAGPHRLIQETPFGTQRILVPPLGDQFPRIC